MPVVGSRHPLWDEPQPLPVAAPGTDRATRALGVEGALEKEMPVTEGLDALPQDTLEIPEPTYLPFVVAVGVAIFFVGLLVEAAIVGVVGIIVGGVAIDAVALADRGGPPMTHAAVVPVVPVETAPATRGYSTAWWGMVVLITTEAMIFLVAALRVLLRAQQLDDVAARRHRAARAAAHDLLHRHPAREQHPDLLDGARARARAHAPGRGRAADQLRDGRRVPRQHRVRLPRTWGSAGATTRTRRSST